MTRGAIYIVTRDPIYLNLVRASVESLKRVMPNLPVTVFSEFPADGPFKVVRVPPAQASDGFFDKARLVAESPYEQTIFLDTDIYVVQPFEELFTLLDRFDCAATHEEYVNSDWNNYYPRPDIPSSYPEFNTGLMVFRRSPEIISVFERWRDLYRGFLSERPGLPTNDQPFFRAAVYFGDAKIATLGREYNCKFRGQGYLNGPVKLLHGHVKFQMKRDYMDRVAGLMNRSLKPRVYVGRSVYEQHITGHLWSLRKPRKVCGFPEPLPLWKLRARGLKELLQRKLPEYSGLFD
jgi:hypothetical protein